MPATPRTLIYSPHDPDDVTSVGPFNLYSNAARTTLVLSIPSGTQNPDGTWTFTGSLNDGTYYTSVTVTYAGPVTEVDSNDLVTLISPSASRWSYVYCPKLGGRAYDPVTNGGQVSILTLTDPVTGGIVAEVGPAERSGFGHYYFEVPNTVPPGVYFGSVSWRPTALETTYHEDDLIVEFPARKNTLIKPWVTLQEVYRYNAELKDVSPGIVLDCIYSATQALYELSGKKYRGVQIYNELYTPSCTLRTGIRSTVGCSCREGIYLRKRPVQHVYQVTYDSSGAIVDPTLYSVDNMNRLVGSYGAHTPIRVTYAAGVEATQLAKTACIALAGEIALYHAGSDACRLPQNVVSVNREGLSFSITDKQEFLDRGLVGVYEVDLFLRSVNPDKARGRAKVLTGSLSRGRQTSILASSCVIETQPLMVRTGEATEFVYFWRAYNTPHPITNYYTIRSTAGDVTLSSYIVAEPNNNTGKIVLTIPAAISDTLVDGASWLLEAVSTATEQTNRLVTGTVRRLY